MPRPPARAPEASPAFPGVAGELRDQLRMLVTPEKPPRPTRDGDLPIDNEEGASLVDHWHSRTITVTSSVYGGGPSSVHDHATLEVRWEATAEPDGTLHQELVIGSHHVGEFRCTGNNEHEALFAPARPHVIRGLATLLTELADRVDADRAAYELLDRIRR